ncbi:MAG TPA: Cof-type HAD-IIB family hydrolase [Ktedonobacteraceae bacterium]|nr:Cof-type HAD-IIB family hydrolase [Ktedonobacteraceae bacterium]
MSARDEQIREKRESVPSRKRTYDLVAIDIDGTLVTSENKLSVAVASLIHETQARGIGVTLVSGRAKMKVTPLLKELGLILPYISSGGAHIIDPSNNLTILYRSLGQAEAAEIVELARAAKVPIISQEPDHLFYEGSVEELEQLIAISKIDIIGVGNLQVEILRVDDVLQASADPSKITICGEPGLLLVIERKLRLLNLPIYLTYSVPTYLEITRSGVNKGEALKLLAAYLAMPLERIVVIGDGRNDISMFEIAGMAVAMGNASEEVKATADLVAPSNDEDGVGWVLRELVLKEHETFGRL